LHDHAVAGTRLLVAHIGEGDDVLVAADGSTRLAAGRL
jgi:hypothetical protein